MHRVFFGRGALVFFAALLVGCGGGGATSAGQGTGSSTGTGPGGGAGTGTGTGGETGTSTSTSTSGGCVDADQDGYGVGCAAGPDCDDTDPSVYDTMPLYTDADGDGFTLEHAGSPVDTCVGASLPAGRVKTSLGQDCDDSDPMLTNRCPSRLMKDLNQAPGKNPGSSPHGFASSILSGYFAATDPRNGVELWKTDLTPGGTRLVADVTVGPADSNPRFVTLVGNTTYFVAKTAELGDELWKTDGTAAGTTVVADLTPGAGDTTFSEMAVVGTRLYFLAKAAGGPVDLWQTDGTAAGTQKLGLAILGTPRMLTPLGNTLFFLVDRSTGQQLFHVNAGGMSKVFPATNVVAKLGLLTRIGNSIYYVNNGVDVRVATETTDGPFQSLATQVQALADGCHQSEGQVEHLVSAPGGRIAIDLHAYLDPTCLSMSVTGQDYWYVASASSAPVLLPGYGGVNSAYQYEQMATYAARSGSNLYFVVWTCHWMSGVCGGAGADELVGSKVLWKYDGTTTTKVATLYDGAKFQSPTPTSSGIYWVGPAGVAGNGATQGKQGDALWLNGSPTAVTAGNGYTNLAPLPVSGAGFYLSARQNGAGGLYYMPAGSVTPTLLASPLTVDTGNVSLVTGFALPPNAPPEYLLFAADDGSHGSEPWVSDRTPGGTTLLADLATDPGSSTPAGYTELNDKVFFSANDGNTGTELYSSDGTTAGTVQVADIWSGKESSSPGAFSVIDDVLYLSANNGYSGVEMWSSHGMIGDPVNVCDIAGGLHSTGSGSEPNSSFPGPFVSFAGKIFFVASDGADPDFELFSYSGSGSPGPATRLLAINPDPKVGSYPSSLTVALGKLFFTADDGANGRQLWVTDGTAAGTMMLKVPGQPKDSLVDSELVVFDGQVYFSAVDAAKGRELWASDGTLAGTRLVDDLDPSGDGDPRSFAVAGSTLYFSATDKAGDRELWKKDGSAPAERVTDLNPKGSSSPEQLVAAGDRVFFAADDGIHGVEPCVSQGTAATTVCFDLRVGPLGSWPQQFLSYAPGHVLFAASDGIAGVELWQSDGTAAGTTMADDIAPGESSSNPAALALSPALDRVFFMADDGAKGVELRSISTAGLGP